MDLNRPESLTTALFKLLKIRTPTMTFYRSTLMGLEIVEDNISCPSMSTNGKQIRYNREWIEHHTVGEIMWTITHELSHVRLDHPYRMQKILNKLGFGSDPDNFTEKDRDAWRVCNIAADCAINPTLTLAYHEDQLGLGIRAPEGALIPKMFALPPNGTMEQYTRMLLKMDENRRKIQEEAAKQKQEAQPDEPSPGGATEGKQQPGGQPGKPTPEAQRQGMKEALQRHYPDDPAGQLQKAVQASDSHGQVEPEGTSQAEKSLEDAGRIAGQGSAAHRIFRQIKEELTPQIDWKILLENKLTKDTADYSWSRQNRRTLDQEVQMPALFNERLPELIILIDVSSSIEEQCLKTFCNEVQGILEATPKKVLIITHNQNVVQDFEWEPGNRDFRYEDLRIGGGTSHQPVFQQLPDYIRKYGIDAETVVIFTDTSTYWPATIPEYLDPMIVIPEDETDITPPPWPCPILRVTGERHAAF